MRKPGAAFPAAGGSQGRIAATSPQRILYTLLELAFGSADSAEAAVTHALALAGHEALPDTGPGLVTFVRAHLLMSLTDHVGARLTMALLDDLIAQVDPSAASEVNPSVPPASMPRPVARIAVRTASSPRGRTQLAVLLVDSDRVGRTALARALVRATWDVTVIESVEELATAFASGEALDGAIVDAQHPAADAILEKLSRERPGIAVVARSADVARARGILGELGVVRFDVRSRDAPAEELIEAVKRTTGV